MKVKLACFVAGLCLLAVAISCSKGATSPASPSGAAPVATDANADGSTIKASPPTPVSPINGVKLDAATTDGVTLVVTNSTSKFGVGLPVSYRFQLFSGTTLIEDSGNVAAGAISSSYTVKTALEGDKTYNWRARPEVDNGAFIGSWSATATFVSPQAEGYITGSEMYDPLINGKTVGAVSGPVTFVPGVGIRLETQLSYVAYVLPQTLTEGEFSILCTDLAANTDGDKTKMFAMAQGFGDVVTNDRRATIEKRGDPPGIIAWRFITNGDQVDAEGAERVFFNFRASETYFWQATWRNNRFNLLIREGGFDGRTVYNFGKNFKGRAYDPNPHVLYLGMPIGRSGENGASVDHVTIRQVWVSGRPRPTIANK